MFAFGTGSARSLPHLKTAAPDSGQLVYGASPPPVQLPTFARHTMRGPGPFF